MRIFKDIIKDAEPIFLAIISGIIVGLSFVLFQDLNTNDSLIVFCLLAVAIFILFLCILKTRLSLLFIPFLFMFWIAYASGGIGVAPAKININTEGLQIINVCVWNEGSQGIDVCFEGDIPVISPSCSLKQYITILPNTSMNNCKKVSIYANVQKSGRIYIKAKPYGTGQTNIIWSVGIYINYTKENVVNASQPQQPTSNQPSTSTPPIPSYNTTRPNITKNDTVVKPPSTTYNTSKPNIAKNETVRENVTNRENTNNGWSSVFNIVKIILIAIIIVGVIVGIIYYVLVIM